MDPLLGNALTVGLITGLLLFSAHWGLDHLAPTFKAHPPRAYSVGVGILGCGCLAWSLLVPGPLPALVVFAYYALIVAVGGLGTWTAWTLHGWQTRRADGATGGVLEGD